MRGEILTYDGVSDQGLISGEDYRHYALSRADLTSGGDPAPGALVDFLPAGDRAAQIIILVQGRAPERLGSRRGAEPALTPWRYVRRCLTTRYLDFSSRARRREYWWFILFSWLVIAAAYLLAFLIGGAIRLIYGPEGFEGIDAPLVVTLQLLPVFVSLILLAIPTFAVSVRRLHDIGVSGWFYLSTFFFPWIGGPLFVIATCLPSHRQDNGWGPSHRHL